jgi:hypothetical protein
MKLARQIECWAAFNVFSLKNKKKSLHDPKIQRIGGTSVRNSYLLLTIVTGCAVASAANAARTDSLTFKPQTAFETHEGAGSSQTSASSKSEFIFKDQAGKTVSVPVVDEYQKDRIIRPFAKSDPHMDPKLSRAATIAEERAHAHSKSRCWHYVKEALVASGAVTSYPKTPLAKQAGDELVRDYGFKKLPIQDPYAAPIGSVLVYYKGRNRPGHVEIRTQSGFASDFRSKVPCQSALIGIYAKK